MVISYLRYQAENMNEQVDSYFIEGCMRCSLGATPGCKVHTWSQELVELRRILNNSGLTEELKWSMPCYTYNGGNVLILSAFKAYCSINFFKGALLSNNYGLLEKQGENAQAGRIIKFTNPNKVLDNEDSINLYIQEAIEIERAGLKVALPKPSELKLPEELLQKMSDDQGFKQAFEALTPGRQKGYIYYFSQPKQAKTRVGRIEKYSSKIFEGKGLNDDYVAKLKNKKK